MRAHQTPPELRNICNRSRHRGARALQRLIGASPSQCHTHTVRGRHCLRPGFRSRGCGLSADLPAPATAVLMLPSTSVVLRLSNRQVRRRPDWLVSSQRAEAATDTTEAGASILTISDGGVTWHARMIPLESKDTLGVGGITTRAGREAGTPSRFAPSGGKRARIGMARTLSSLERYELGTTRRVVLELAIGGASSAARRDLTTLRARTRRPQPPAIPTA